MADTYGTRTRQGSSLTPTDSAPTIDRAEGQFPDSARDEGNGYPPASPGHRSQDSTEKSMTNRLDAADMTNRMEHTVVEHTPAPLPPSPAAEVADIWLESVATNPQVSPSLDDALTTASLEHGRDSMRALPAPARKVQRGPDRSAWFPISATVEPMSQAAPTPLRWKLPALIAATSLAVGMVIGALVFGGKAEAAAADKKCETAPVGQAP